ncbi:hypothetical protein OG21DRAFT_1506294 [Imleria badia]|nr:hypothetical protein OG21DRAFT_1506294 [Imleria badia]
MCCFTGTTITGLAVHKSACAFACTSSPPHFFFTCAPTRHGDVPWYTLPKSTSTSKTSTPSNAATSTNLERWDVDTFGICRQCQSSDQSNGERAEPISHLTSPEVYLSMCLIRTRNQAN